MRVGPVQIRQKCDLLDNLRALGARTVAPGGRDRISFRFLVRSNVFSNMSVRLSCTEFKNSGVPVNLAYCSAARVAAG